MRLLGILLVASLGIACAGRSPVAVGVVTGVDARSITDIQTFKLRTFEGTTMTFRVAELELDGGAFPASHLTQHMLTAEPIAVAFRDGSPHPEAYRLVDAPWARP